MRGEQTYNDERAIIWIWVEKSKKRRETSIRRK